MIMKFEDHTISMIKKRRTKRPPRQVSPAAVRMASSSSSSTIQFSGGGADHLSSSSSPELDNNNNRELSVELEEEDMANCLILLAQGRRDQEPPFSAASVAGGVGNKEVYECKTCNRIFSSFQALGGHRASHKKPKASPTTIPTLENQSKEDVNITTLSLQIPTVGVSPNDRNRMHECSICGAEFTSGQALGGHMRRHRPLPPPTPATAAGREDSSSQETNKKQRNLLSFDLNMPAAPEENHREANSNFPFPASKERVIVFSTSSLVDCHY